MPNSPIILALFGFSLASCLFAFWRGGPAERIGAGVILANLLLTLGSSMAAPAGLQPLIQLGLDGLTALVLAGLALLYASLWIGVVMILYAAQFALHGYYLVAQKAVDSTHVIVNNGDFLLVSLSLAVGTAVAWRRREAAGRGVAPL